MMPVNTNKGDKNTTATHLFSTTITSPFPTPNKEHNYLSTYLNVSASNIKQYIHAIFWMKN